MTAVVLGATGAIGRELVGQLLVSGNWSKVITVGRREVQLPAGYTNFKAELQQAVVNMDTLEEQGKALFQGADTIFCALGTTRKDAGSAENFKKVDYEYVAKSAAAAKAAGVPHYCLVSAQGANAGLWASDLKPFHGLLYAKTKGMAEQAVISQSFPRVSIFRPGMLERGDVARPGEKIFSKVMNSIPVADVARVMILDAERSRGATGLPAVSVYEMDALKASAKSGRAP